MRVHGSEPYTLTQPLLLRSRYTPGFTGPECPLNPFTTAGLRDQITEPGDGGWMGKKMAGMYGTKPRDCWALVSGGDGCRASHVIRSQRGTAAVEHRLVACSQGQAR